MRGSSWEKKGADPLENSNLINSQSKISENRPQISPGKQINPLIPPPPTAKKSRSAHTYNHRWQKAIDPKDILQKCIGKLDEF